jgi:hypothetical protein
LKRALIPNALTELDNDRVASHPLVRGLLSGWLEGGNQRWLSGSGQQPDSGARKIASGHDGSRKSTSHAAWIF